VPGKDVYRLPGDAGDAPADRLLHLPVAQDVWRIDARPETPEVAVGNIRETGVRVKKTKESVDYSRGHPDSRCGLCEHFVPGRLRGQLGECELVRGTIDPRFWCRLFEGKRRAA